MPLLHADLETTGLDKDTDHILEVAWTLTDNSLRSPWPVPVNGRVITPNPETWDLIAASQFIQDMHGPTGLLKDLGDFIRTDDLASVEREILGDIEEYEASGRGSQTWYLAGASVHFDLGFIQHWMPNLAKRLHHRVFDTSTLRAFFQALGIDHGVVNPMPHRAVHDVEEMLEMSRRYRKFTKELIRQADWSAGGVGLAVAIKAAREEESWSERQGQQLRIDTEAFITEMLCL